MILLPNSLERSGMKLTANEVIFGYNGGELQLPYSQLAKGIFAYGCGIAMNKIKVIVDTNTF